MHFHPLHDRVVVRATYRCREKTAGELITTESRREQAEKI
jgi:co-chaperonin GroES (HSP10)